MKQDIFTGTGGNNLWTTAANWSANAVPGANDDAYIGKQGVNAQAQLETAVTVNSIGTNRGSSLLITNNGSLKATNGTDLSHNDTAAAGSGNNGTIRVEMASLQIQGSFKNAGTIEVGSQAQANIDTIDGSLRLFGGGEIRLGVPGTARGDIIADNVPLVNDDNRITGGLGSIFSKTFDNQEKGVIDVVKSAEPAFTISATDGFKNEGKIKVETDAKLHLGNFETQSLVNSGTITLSGERSQLEINGNYTVSGHGSINMSGAGSSIVSGDLSPSAFTNKSDIVATATGRIGDSHLTFDNSGLVDAKGTGTFLTLNTGTNVIDDAGGTLKAEKGGVLLIQSDVTTGSAHGSGGSIEADKGSSVVIGASVKSGVSSNGSSGKIVIDGGAVVFGAGSSADVPVTFTNNGGTLFLENSTNVNVSGSKGEIDLGNQAKVSVNGDHDTFKCGVDNTISAKGNHESFAFGPATGASTVSGWNSTDSMQLARSDFANWGSLLQHTQQVGADTVISTGANESITLKGVAVSSLNQSQFHFA